MGALEPGSHGHTPLNPALPLSTDYSSPILKLDRNFFLIFGTDLGCKPTESQRLKNSDNPSAYYWVCPFTVIILRLLPLRSPNARYR